MTAALGDLIQVNDNQTYLGEDLINVYFYRVTSITGLTGNYLELIGNWFIDAVIEPVRAIQNAGLIHSVLELRNVSNNIDLYEVAPALPGTISATDSVALPSWMTVNFKLIRETLTTRNGSKRFSGLVEANAAANAYTIGAVPQANIEAALAADVVLGVATVAEPVIVRRPIVPPVGGTYVYSSIGSAAYTKYGTQNTRKP